MIQKETLLEVVDNSGAKTALCIHVMRGKSASVGDVIVAVTKDVIPGGKVRSGQIFKAVVVRVCTNHPREDGSFVRFDRNAVVLVDNKFAPVGTRVFGAVMREVRNKNFMRIASLAAEVV